MSDGQHRKVSLQDIQLVQNLIERCLQLYMSQREVVSTLLYQAKIEPSFTELVWQKLEAQNEDFFRHYNVRLGVKEQIVRFNELLDRQVELMQQMNMTKVDPLLPPNGHQLHSKHESPVSQASGFAMPFLNEENLHPNFRAPPNLWPLQPVQFNLADGYGGAENALLTQRINTGMMQWMNGAMINGGDRFNGDSTLFHRDNNYVEHSNVTGNMSIPSFVVGESNFPSMNDSSFNLGMNSFGSLEQIPQNISFPDLTPDFSNSSDIVGNYTRSPFHGSVPNFFNGHIQGEQDPKQMNTISEWFWQ